jgi:hypothetical protein
MHRAAFRLTDNIDPEERLEEAALWKAMYDHYGPDGIVGVHGTEAAPEGLPVFGRSPRFPAPCANPVPEHLPYWTDPAFIAACGREFHVAPFEEAEVLVADLHMRGKGAFLKSTRLKHFTASIPPGASFRDVVGPMAFSFIDGGPLLMVQELATIEYEYRYFVIDRGIVTFSPNMTSLTPIDHPLQLGTVYRTPQSRLREYRPEIVRDLHSVAGKVADTMSSAHACLDIAMINGVPGVVEMNPMQIGQIGLFACSVRALAEASEELVASYDPGTAPAFKPLASSDEEEFIDFGPP